MSLAAAVLSLVPFEGQLAEPLGLLPPQTPSEPASPHSLTAPVHRAVTAMFAAAGLRGPRLIPEPPTLSTFDKIAAEALAVASAAPAELEDPEGAVARVRDCGDVRRPRVRSSDGVELCAFFTGRATGTPVLVFGAPGTPVGLSAGWLLGIGEERPVAIWETRGLFGPGAEAVSSLGIEAQVSDACAVMNAAEWPAAHVLAICGGAALALAFAVKHPERVRSLGLWFGDYELGKLAPKTAHQRNLQALMQMFVHGRVTAEQFHAVLLQTMTKFSEPDLAPFALYPYANPGLLGRYCRMNYPIMSTDCSDYLDHVRAPCLVAYAPDDVTTHPEGSRMVAQRLSAQLEAISATGHLHAFRGCPSDVHRVRLFFRSQD